MPKIFRLLLVAVVLVIGMVWFVHWSRTRAHNTGSLNANQLQTTPDIASTNQGNSSAVASPTAGEAAPLPATTSKVQLPASSTAMVPMHDGPITDQPTANALSPNPPAGFVTPASQKFALYRQGDLTYRLNTQSGQACVLFASEDLWRKPLVYQHGCAGH